MNGIEYILGYLDKHSVISSLHRQVVLFLIIGSICFFIDMTILMLLVEIFSLNVILANCISVIIATYVSYVLNIRFIFQNGKFGLKKEISLFYVFSIISFFLNILFLYILVELFIIWYVPSKVIVTAIVALFNFSTRKWFIFSG